MNRMKLTAVGVLVLASVPAFAFEAGQVAGRVSVDAAVLDRVAEASKRDLPDKLLKRIVEEDIELMRGLRPDGTYEYATWDRFEAGRTGDSFAIKASEESMQTVEVKGAFVYRVVLEVPGRRYMVRRNRPVWIERVDLEYVGEQSKNERTSIEVKGWLQPGEFRPVDFPVVARQATARVVATADPAAGPGTLAVALVKARLVDLATSPYAAAVAAAKTALKALGENDVAAVRSAAQRLRDALTPLQAVGASPLPPAPQAQPASPPPSASADSASRVELQAELQLVEDLLTGNESERREGLDRLHQLIRRLRQGP